MGKSTISVIFNSYVKLPEGIPNVVPVPPCPDDTCSLEKSTVTHSDKDHLWLPDSGI